MRNTDEFPTIGLIFSLIAVGIVFYLAGIL